MNLNYLRYKMFKPFKSWKNKYLKYITQKEAKENNLYDGITREISEYTGEPVGIVKEKHKLGPQRENNYEIFENQQELNNSAIEDFYRKCSYYLYELPLWNSERNRPEY